MKRQSVIMIIFLAALTAIFAFRPSPDGDCNCDKEKVEKIIRSKDFNRIAQFDDTLTGAGFYNLSAYDNRTLWYRDIESPEKTKFTLLWNAELPTGYRASHLDFIKHYQDKQDIELAFQFGPNQDLWSYHVFVVREIECCYLITRSYYRYSKFRDRRYAVLDKPQLDSLFTVIYEQQVLQIDTTTISHYCAFFRDNRNQNSFYINLDREPVRADIPGHPTSSLLPEGTGADIIRLFNFIDKQIKWSPSQVF